ncbi:MAG: hypothetical protein AUF65_02440 [Chloroflexi bacterium 13_1_20CM_50_12]|nr:MAG: hypothetical protein AUF65_02440 [Chloroflexi bacterium 13_1_20CM_50_12]
MFPGGPNNLSIIGTSPATGILGTGGNGLNGAGVGNTTTYVASSGSLVFATGSMFWTWALDLYRQYPPTPTNTIIPGMQQLMAHIMTALIRPRNPTGFSAFSAHR